MSIVIKQLKLYARLTLFVALALVVGLVILKNRNHRVTVWFFGTYESVNVLWLMLCTAGASVVSWWVVLTTRGVWRDMRELHQATEARRQQAELEKRAEEIAQAERRVDKKLRDAAGGDSE